MYLITNTSFRDSLWVEGTRIGSQKTATFEDLKPLTLAILKRTSDAKIQYISKRTETKSPNTDFTTMSDTNKQKSNKKTVTPVQSTDNDSEISQAKDDVVDDKEN